MYPLLQVTGALADVCCCQVLHSLTTVPGRGAFNSLPPTSPGLCNGICGLPGTALLQVHGEEGRVQIQHVVPDSWGWWDRNAVLTAGIGLKADWKHGGEARRGEQAREAVWRDGQMHARCVQAHVEEQPAGTLGCSCSLSSTSIPVFFPVLSTAWIIFNKCACTAVHNHCSDTWQSR